MGMIANAKPAEDCSRFFRKLFVPSADAVRSGAALPWHLAPKPAFVPFWIVVGDQGKFSREYPPFAGKRQIAALHAVQRYIAPLIDLTHMLIEATAQGSLAFGSPFGRFADAPQCALMFFPQQHVGAPSCRCGLAERYTAGLSLRCLASWNASSASCPNA